MSLLERRFRDFQIVIITIFVVVSSVGIKRVDYKINGRKKYLMYSACQRNEKILID